MFERFTQRARRAIVLAQDEARSLGHNFLGTEHLLMGLIVEGEGVAGRTLTQLGLDAATVRADIDEIIGITARRASDSEVLRAIGIDLDEVISVASEAFGAERVTRAMVGAPGGQPAFVPRAKKVLELALREALSLGHNYVGTEHILLAIVREGNGVAAQILVKRTAGLDEVREAVLTTLRSYPKSGS